MIISNKISKLMENSSWIRAMFEEGERLKEALRSGGPFRFYPRKPDRRAAKGAEERAP